MTHTNFNKSTVCKSNPTGNSGDGKQRKDQEREQKTEQRREQLTWRREKINVVAETARERTGVDLGRARGRRKRDYLSLMANLLTATLFTTSIYTSNITIYPPHTHTHTSSPPAGFIRPGCQSAPQLRWVSDYFFFVPANQRRHRQRRPQLSALSSSAGITSHVQSHSFTSNLLFVTDNNLFDFILSLC